MKIPFDIKFRPQIESGEYKVETATGKQARIICWDKKSDMNKKKIVALLDDGNSEHTEYYTENGTVYEKAPAGGDLFLITPETEMSEFEEACMKLYNEGRDDGFSGERVSDEAIKESASELLALAREELVRQGYVIEKKAFHDAVEKVEPEVKKEVSANIDLANFVHDLGERYPEVSFAKLTRIAKAAYDYGRKELQSEFEAEIEKAYKNADEVVFRKGVAHGKVEALKTIPNDEDMKAMLQLEYEKGRADVLKDLPRWEKDGIPVGSAAVDISGLGGFDFIRRAGRLIRISSLEKLPKDE